MERLSLSVWGNQISNGCGHWNHEGGLNRAINPFGSYHHIYGGNEETPDKRGLGKECFQTLKKQASAQQLYLVCINIWGHSLVKEIRAHSSCLEGNSEKPLNTDLLLEAENRDKDYLSLNMQLKRQGPLLWRSGIITSCVTKQIQTTDLGAAARARMRKIGFIISATLKKPYIDCFF